MPVLLIFLAFAIGSDEANAPVTLILHHFAAEIGIGAGVGILCTVVGAHLFRFAHDRGWIGEIWMQVTVPALALTCFATAQSLDGSGFIACFVGGLIAGALVREHKASLLLAAEGTGDTLALLTWVTFGATVAGSVLEHFAWNALLYAVLSLTVIRMLPVFLSLTGTGLTAADKLFIGWFGPRGLASIVFLVIVLNEHLPGGEILKQTVVWTVIISILAHGLSANPLARLYGARKSE